MFGKISVSIFALMLVLSLPSLAQNIKTLEAYRSSANPDYWGNRLPHPAYWQQDVYHKIHARLDEDTDILTADLTLHYRNNSPDTLNVLYFHLYQNAFTPDSYMDKMNQRRNYNRNYGKYEIQGLGTTVSEIRVNGTEVVYYIDNTIMKVVLNEALLPNAELQLTMNFKTYFERDGAWRRMKCWTNTTGVHYNGAHWYPRIAVYDAKFGWNVDQHFGHEFYGEFGVYDVALDMPNNQIVGASGLLTNRDEMLPEDLRKKIDIANFSKPVDTVSVPITYEKGARKVWKFHAENVHDFAFIADPSFRIGHEAISLESGKVVHCYAFAMEQNAHKWQDAAQIAARTIKIFSDGIGEYAYPKMIVADCRAGMEYPMLTMDSGGSPHYTHLLVHEIGHNWFFGAVGSNETYRALLDEGFTQYLTVYGLEGLKQKYQTEDIGKYPKTKYARKYQYQQTTRYNVVYARYLQNAIQEGGQQLNVHSDYFNEDHPYGNAHRQVYYKTAAMLYNLEYVLGDELFARAMRNYYHQWKFAHPYDEDMRASFIHFTGVDLNWFFDQWIDTDKNIDYKITKVKTNRKTGLTMLTFERKGEMQMPIDFHVKTMDGKVHDFHIPNTEFIKQTNAIILPKWTGWDELNKEYQVEIKLSEEFYSVEIDSTLRLADVYQVDNKYPRAIDFVVDMGIDQEPVWEHYRIYARPDLWYNGYDGIKAGLHLNGSYMEYKHQFDFNFWFNTGSFQYRNESMTHSQQFNQAAFRFNYQTETDKFIPYSYLKASAKYLDGLQDYALSFVKQNKKRNHNFYIQLRSFFRQDTIGMNYLIYPNEWGMATEEYPGVQYNNTRQIGFQHSYHDGEMHVFLKNSGLLSSYSFTQLTGELKENTHIHKLKLKTRIFGQIAMGERIPIESQLYLAGGSPEEMMEDKYMRSYGFFPQQEYGKTSSYMHFGGGLNLRGYAGYLAPYNLGDEQYYLYRSNAGYAINLELEFDQYIPLRIRSLQKVMNLNTYLFADAGSMSYTDTKTTKLPTFSNYYADAGVGAALNIHSWGDLTKAKPLTIRFDVPLYLSNIPFADGQAYKFRWLLGIGRAF